MINKGEKKRNSHTMLELECFLPRNDFTLTHRGPRVGRACEGLHHSFSFAVLFLDLARESAPMIFVHPLRRHCQPIHMLQPPVSPNPAGPSDPGRQSTRVPI